MPNDTYLARLRATPYIRKTMEYVNQMVLYLNNLQPRYSPFVFYLAGNNNVQNMLQLFGQYSPGRVPFGSYFYIDVYQLTNRNPKEGDKYSLDDFGFRLGYRVLLNNTLQYETDYSKVDLTNAVTDRFNKTNDLGNYKRTILDEDDEETDDDLADECAPLKYVTYDTWTNSEGNTVDNARFILASSLDKFVWSQAGWAKECGIAESQSSKINSLTQQVTDLQSKLDVQVADKEELAKLKESLASEKEAHSSADSSKDNFTVSTIIVAVLAFVELVVIIVLIVFMFVCRRSSSSTPAGQTPVELTDPHEDPAIPDTTQA